MWDRPQVKPSWFVHDFISQRLMRVSSGSFLCPKIHKFLFLIFRSDDWKPEQYFCIPDKFYQHFFNTILTFFGPEFYPGSKAQVFKVNNC
jgi:hypothetical protein